MLLLAIVRGKKSNDDLGEDERGKIYSKYYLIKEATRVV